ncbi:MAG: phage head closure protein [Peptostreptococcales bacterium]
MKEDMRNRVEVWSYTTYNNKLGEITHKPKKIITIWAAIIPQTGSLQKQQAETVLSNVTHKIITRYSSGKSITQDMWLIYQGKRFDIKFILNPFYKNETLELFCEQVIE